LERVFPNCHPFQNPKKRRLERGSPNFTRSKTQKSIEWNGVPTIATRSKIRKSAEWNGVPKIAPVPKLKKAQNGTGFPKHHPFQNPKWRRMERVFQKKKRKKPPRVMVCYPSRGQ